MAAGLQLVVPCYNEAVRFDAAHFLELVGTRNDTTLLFVDDGSTDGTPTLLADLCARCHGRASVLTLSRNVGKAEAIRLGVLDALQRQPRFVGYWDADLSTPLESVADFLGVLEANADVDIVIGSRVRLLGRQIRRNPIRHYCGRAFATAASLALGIGVYDTQCGAKIFRMNEWLGQAFAAPFQSRWLVDVEVLARYVAAAGRASAESRICEFPLRTWTEVPGSKLSLWQAMRAVWDLAKIWRRSAA